MCKELDEELQRGQQAFEQIAEHAYAMNADSIEQSIPRRNKIYKIKCELVSSVPFGQESEPETI